MSETSSHVKRSISMSAKTYGDLKTLCDALGVNIHSYMVNELAKAIQRDSLALSVRNTQAEAMAKMMEMVSKQD